MNLHLMVYIVYGALLIYNVGVIVYITWKYLACRKNIFKRVIFEDFLCICYLGYCLFLSIYKDLTIFDYLFQGVVMLLCEILNILCQKSCWQLYQDDDFLILDILTQADFDPVEYRNLSKENKENYVRNIFSEHINHEQIFFNRHSVCTVATLLKELDNARIIDSNESSNK